MCSNVEGFEAPPHFCMDSNDSSAVETLVGNFIDYLERIFRAAFAIYMADPDIRAIFDEMKVQLAQEREAEEAREADGPNKKKKKKKKQTHLQRFFSRLESHVCKLQLR